MDFAILEYLRSEGLVDEHRLAHQLGVSLSILRKALAHLHSKGFLRVITRTGSDCRRCDSRLSCPGSRVHSKEPKGTFKAYQLTSSGMRYHRVLRQNQIPEKGF